VHCDRHEFLLDGPGVHPLHPPDELVDALPGQTLADHLADGGRLAGGLVGDLHFARDLVGDHRLTDRLEAEAAEYISTIDGLGGALAGIERGFQQREIQEAAYRFQRQIEEKERVIVGVNEFVVQEPAPGGLLRVNPAIGAGQREKLAKLRAGRDNAAVEAHLGRLQRAAEGTENLLPIMVEAVEVKVTLGEISHRLRGVWGEQRESVVI